MQKMLNDNGPVAKMCQKMESTQYSVKLVKWR